MMSLPVGYAFGFAVPIALPRTSALGAYMVSVGIPALESAPFTAPYLLSRRKLLVRTNP